MRSGKADFGTVEIARMLRVHQTTVAKWIDSGRLPCHRTVGRHRRVTRRALIDFIHELQFPLPIELQLFSGRFLVLCRAAKEAQILAHAIRRVHPRADILVLHDIVDALLRIGDCRPEILLLSLDWTPAQNAGVCRACLELSMDPSARVWIHGVSSRLEAVLKALPPALNAPDFLFCLPQDADRLEAHLMLLR